ncbi:MAG: hypothetical protein QW227_02115 [Candidatus Aenigmatarchaeota archaeon]
MRWLTLLAMLAILPTLVFAAPLAETGGNLTAGQLNNTITPICGDGTCSPGETCFTCPSDCGICGTTGGGGGGGPPPLRCPICPNASAWSACINGVKTRTNYYCNATTNYLCEAFIESQGCVVTVPTPPAPIVTEADASAAIAAAEAAIMAAKADNRDTTSAEATLADARTAFSQHDWISAKNLADYALQQAQTAPPISVPTTAILPAWWLLVGLILVVIASYTAFLVLRYEHIEDIANITRQHVGKRIVVHGTLEPIKTYPNGDVVFRLHKQLVAIGRHISTQPSRRYCIWGRVHLADGAPYLKIHRLETLS